MVIWLWCNVKNKYYLTSAIHKPVNPSAVIFHIWAVVLYQPKTDVIPCFFYAFLLKSLTPYAVHCRTSIDMARNRILQAVKIIYTLLYSITKIYYFSFKLLPA